MTKSPQTIVLSKEKLSPTEMAHAFAASGYFDKTTKVSQALVKMIAGQELGLGATAAINGLHYIDGSLTPGSNVMATLVKDSPLHNYKIIELTHVLCTLRFFERESVEDKLEAMSPDVTFTIDDAQRAGLIKPRSAWEKWEPNMLFARAMSNGFKWHTPQLSKGTPLYDRTDFDSVEEWEETDVELSEEKLEELPSANILDEGDPVAEDPELSGNEPTEEGVTSAGGERLDNQWEEEILDKACDLGFARAPAHAVNILNKSPFLGVPYMELNLTLAIAWFVCWSSIGENNKDLDGDAKKAKALLSWGVKEDREGYKAIAVSSLGGE